MELKFWNIGKANEEIERLTALAAATPAVSAEAETIKLDLAKAQSDLTKVTSDFTALKAAHAKEISDLMAAHEEDLKVVDADVDVRASKRALAIVASQGTPAPLANKPGATAPGVEVTKPKNALRGLAKAIAAHQADAAK
jgi:hypothetical protein